MKHSIKLLLFCSVVLTLVYISCSKTDRSSIPDARVLNSIEETFFNSHRTSDVKENELVEYLIRQNKKLHFVEKTAQQIGFPRWDKAISKKSNDTKIGRTASDSSIVTFIPFVRDSEEFVNASMVIRTQPGDTTFSYLCDWQYSRKENNPTQLNDSAEYYAVFFMALDNNVFGHTQFAITDSNLFRNGGGKAVYVNFQNSGTSSVKSSLLVPVEFCQQMLIYYENCQYVGSQFCTPTCDHCSWCMSTYSFQFCWEEYIEDGTGISNGTGNTGNTGGGGGGGSSGGGSTPPDCNFSVSKLAVQEGCSPGWVPTGTGSNVTTSIAPEPDPTITNTDPDYYWWFDVTTSFPLQPKPNWANVYANYPKKPDGSEMCGEEVYNLVGGTVLGMMPASKNACAVRVSRALNYSGVNIPHIPNHTFQGADGKYYFLSAAKLYNWMSKAFGPPDLALSQSQGGPNGQNFSALLSGHKGIYLMQPNFPAQFGATGHASLYTGNSCMTHDCAGGPPSNGCYFNATGGVNKISLWELQ